MEVLTTLLNHLAFSKVCARWVPRELTAERETDRVNVCTEFLEQ